MPAWVVRRKGDWDPVMERLVVQPLPLELTFGGVRGYYQHLQVFLAIQNYHSQDLPLPLIATDLTVQSHLELAVSESGHVAPAAHLFQGSDSGEPFEAS